MGGVPLPLLTPRGDSLIWLLWAANQVQGLEFTDWIEEKGGGDTRCLERVQKQRWKIARKKETGTWEPFIRLLWFSTEWQMTAGLWCWKLTLASVFRSIRSLWCNSRDSVSVRTLINLWPKHFKMRWVNVPVFVSVSYMYKWHVDGFKTDYADTNVSIICQKRRDGMDISCVVSHNQLVLIK